MAYVFGSIWDRFNRNALNDLSKSVEQQGKSIQDLVAEGQLTEGQYARLITTINGLIKSGHVDKSDLTSEFKDEIEGFSTQLAKKVDEAILDESTIKFYAQGKLVSSVDVSVAGNASAVQDYIETLVANGQIDGVRLGEKTVKPVNTTFIEHFKSVNMFDKNHADNVEGYYIDATRGDAVISKSFMYSHLIPVEVNNTYAYPVYPVTFGASSNRIALYNSEGKYIGYELGVITDDINVVTISNAAAVYAKVSIAIGTYPIQKDQFMFVEGSVYPSEYESFVDEFKLAESYYSKTVINNLIDSETVLKFIDDNSNFPGNSHLETNPLYGKIAVFDGDSIAHGGSANDGLSGWAGRIGSRNNMTWQNYARGGGTITAETYSGETPRHWLSRNVVNLRSDADYIIFEGGTNDADVVPIDKVGVITPSFTSPLDDTTICGAVESLFKQAIIKYPDKKIGFIVAHKMGLPSASRRRETFDLIIEICEKWGIPYIDLWRGSHLNSGIPEIRELMYTDGQHLSSQGYDFITPKIESWMKTL